MKQLAATFCRKALAAMQDSGPAERADHLEFAADILDSHALDEMAVAARRAAQDLRNAEASQLKFQALLLSAINQNIVP